jgi:Phasin protein
MSSTGQDKPTAKPSQHNGKTARRRQKPAPPQAPKPDQLASPEPGRLPSPGPGLSKIPGSGLPPDAKKRIDAVDPSPIPAAVPPDASPISAAAPAADAPVSIQIIANAYRDYTRKSLEETTSFVEKLTGARSFDKAIEIQAEFASRAYATFVAQSQKICELHSEFARQTLRPLERLVTGTSRNA